MMQRPPKIRQGGGGTCAARLSTLEHAVFGLDIVTTAMLPWHAMAFPLVSRQALVLDCVSVGGPSGLRKGFELGGGPELEAYRPALSEAVLDRDSVWDTCKTCSRTTKMPQHPITRPAAAVPLSCRSFSPSPTSDDGRGATRETHRILIALPDARSCLGIADADPDDRRKHGAPTGRNRHLRVLSRSSLPVLSGCPHRRGRQVLHVRVIPLRR